MIVQTKIDQRIKVERSEEKEETRRRRATDQGLPLTFTKSSNTGLSGVGCRRAIRRVFCFSGILDACVLASILEDLEVTDRAFR